MANGSSEGDFIIRLIKEVSGLDGEITGYKITLKTESVPMFNLKKLLKLKHDFNIPKTRE